MRLVKAAKASPHAKLYSLSTGCNCIMMSQVWPIVMSKLLAKDARSQGLSWHVIY